MREKICPECRWTAVVDSTGRRHIEMRWAVPAAPVNRPTSRAA